MNFLWYYLVLRNMNNWDDGDDMPVLGWIGCFTVVLIIAIIVLAMILAGTHNAGN